MICRATRPTVFVILALAPWLGCVEPGGQEQSVAGSLVQTDSGRSQAADQPAVIRFAVELSSEVSGPIYVLLNGEDNQLGWVAVSRGPDRIYFRERCEVEDCARLGVVCGAAVSMVSNIAGEGGARTIEYEWNGITSVLDPVSGCESRETSPPGDYVARFCYSREARFEGEADETGAVPGRLLNPTCVEKRFALDEREVVLII